MTRHRPLPVPIEEIPFVVRPEELSPPFDWALMFGRPGRVEIEIGMGKGLFLVEAARLRPECNFLGIERAGKWFRRAVARLLRAGRPNVRVIQADAFALLGRWVAPASVDAFHVYFPDPWPKKRHARRRLLQPELYRLMAECARPDSPFHLGSDVASYFEHAMSEIEGSGLWVRSPWPEEDPDRIPTNYALKYLREGRALRYARFLRTPGTAPGHLPPYPAEPGVESGRSPC
jgi:tRNA (guanine-N7-)-methyltransferase